MRDYEKASIMKKRAFYERSTETIRACPENYCLAVRHSLNPNGWIVYDDGACKKYYPAIQLIIDQYGKWSTGDALADEISKVCPSYVEGHGYDVWQ